MSADTTTLENLTRPIRTRPLPFDWERIRELCEQGKSDKEIAEATGYNLGSLRVGLTTRGLRKVRLKAVMGNFKPRNGNVLKEKLGVIAENAADELSKKTPKSGPGLNLHVDSALKTAKLGATIYGWDSDRTVGLVAIGVIGERDDEAIDVPSVTQDIE